MKRRFLIIFFLQDDVQHKVAKFFTKINQYFVNEQIEGAIPENFISRQVKKQYEELKKITDDKDEIFNSMVQFFLAKSKLPVDMTNLKAAACIVAYFIQLCEVFDAPAK